MLLSIIIVNWNTVEFLLRCLESINREVLALGTENVEVIVVDNASADGSVAAINRSFPTVTTIANERNRGFAQANNQALVRSTGQYILLLNPDTELGAGSLPALIDFLAEKPKAGAAGARLLNADGTLQTSCFPSPTLGRELWRLLHLDVLHNFAEYDMNHWPTDQPRSVDVLLGACLLLRGDVLRKVGLLDERYFVYSEEVDWCLRIRTGGYKIFWVPQAIVVHHGGQSTRQALDAMFLQLYMGKLAYFRKHYGRFHGRLYKAILLLTSLLRLLVMPAASLVWPQQRQENQQLAGRYRRLIRALPTM